MKKVISYALFGDPRACSETNPRVPYHKFLPAVVRAHHMLFPKEQGWVLRIHHDGKIFDGEYGTALRALAGCGLIETVYIGTDVQLTKAMLWRMDPLFDDTTDAVFCRDIDALPTPRDRACCDEFLASSALAHVIYDSDVHIGLMGGMCGFKTQAFRERTGLKSLGELYALAPNAKWEKHGTDQDVLNYHITPMFGMDLLVKRCLLPKNEYDNLALHIGAAGFDVKAVVDFYDNCGDSVILRIRDAEKRALEKK